MKGRSARVRLAAALNLAVVTGGFLVGPAAVDGSQRGRRQPPPDLELMTVGSLMTASAPPSDVRVAYGGDAAQFGDLRVPDGPGPHPVAVMIHGGCWLEFLDLEHFGVPAAALADRGVATWNIEYRRLDMEGGGWPGTFLDVGAGIDHLREVASEHDLDLDRVITVGHSSGGHLALWGAGRHRIDTGSELHVSDPLRVAGAVSLGGIPELRRFRDIDQNDEICGRDVVDELMGGGPRDFPERYLVGSPFQMLPLDVPQRHISGAYDRADPRSQVRPYDYEASQVDDSRLVVVPNAGHFEVMWPGTDAWAVTEREILDLLGMDR